MTHFIKQYLKVIVINVIIHRIRRAFIYWEVLNWWQRLIFQNWKLKFIIDNEYCQSSSLKWQTHFVHFQENVWKYPSLNNQFVNCFSSISDDMEKKISFSLQLKQLHKCFSRQRSYFSTQSALCMLPISSHIILKRCLLKG